jgi:hypothetical protein
MKISMDKVDKTEALSFGYVLNDFRDIENITFWTD